MLLSNKDGIMSHGVLRRTLFTCILIVGLAIILFVITGSENAEAATRVDGGEVSDALYPGGWNNASAPYFIEGDIWVPNGLGPGDNRLTIDGSGGPVDIYFNGSYSLRIGSPGDPNPAILQVNGVKNNIRFTRNSTGIVWKGIKFENSASLPSIIDNANITYVSGKNDMAVWLNGTSGISINNNEIGHVTGITRAVGIGLYDPTDANTTEGNFITGNYIHNISASSPSTEWTCAIRLFSANSNLVNLNIIENIHDLGPGQAIGIYLFNSSQNTINSNTIDMVTSTGDGGAMGMELKDDCDQNTLTLNQISVIRALDPSMGNAYGFFIHSDNPFLAPDGNTVLQATVDDIYSQRAAAYGIVLEIAGFRNRISQCDISKIFCGQNGFGGSGIDVFNSPNSTIENNDIFDLNCLSETATMFGLNLGTTNFAYVANNTFFDLRSNGTIIGIYLDVCFDTTLINNQIENITGNLSIARPSACGVYGHMNTNSIWDDIRIFNVTSSNEDAYGIYIDGTTNEYLINVRIDEIVSIANNAVGFKCRFAGFNTLSNAEITDITAMSGFAEGLNAENTNNDTYVDITISGITGLTPQSSDVIIGVNLTNIMDTEILSLELNTVSNTMGHTVGMRIINSENLDFSDSRIKEITAGFAVSQAIGIQHLDSTNDVFVNIRISDVATSLGAVSGLNLINTVGSTYTGLEIMNITSGAGNLAVGMDISSGSSQTEVHDSTISNVTTLEEAVGIYVQFSSNDVVLENITIWDTQNGIKIMNAQRTYMGNHTIFNCEFGIVTEFAQDITLFNCDIHDNTLWGIFLDMGSNGAWFVDSPSTFLRNDGLFNGPLTVNVNGNMLISQATLMLQDVQVEGGGELLAKDAKSTIISWNVTVSGLTTLDNSSWEMNCTYDGQYKIEVAPTGNLQVINDSLVTAYDTDFRYDFWVNGTATFTNCTIEYVGYSFDQGSLGVLVTTDSVKFDNVVFNNCTGGIIAWASRPQISNIESYNCTITIALLDADTLSITNVTVRDMVVPPGEGAAAILVENYSSVSLYDIDIRRADPGASGIMFVNSSNGYVENAYIQNVTAGLIIENSQVYITDSQTLGGHSGIRMSNGANVIITDCLISENTDVGIDFHESGGTVYNCSITNNNIYGINLNNSSPTIEECDILGHDLGLIAGNSSSPLVVNSTISSVINDFHVNDDSHPVSLNCTFTNSSTTIWDTSTLTVQWFLHIEVQDSLGATLPSVNVRVEDNANGTFDSSYTTDGAGRVNWIIITEYIENSTEWQYLSPYTLSAWNATHYGVKMGYIWKSMLIMITLDSEPELVIGKVAGMPNYVVGDMVTYTVWYNYTGLFDLTDVYLNDTFHPNLEYISDTSGRIPIPQGNSYSWFLGNVTPGNHSFGIILKLHGGIPNGTLIGNEFDLQYSDPNYVPQTPMTSNTVSIAALAAEITLEKSVENSSLNLGDYNTYTIWYNNTGAASAPVVWINDTFHVNLTIVFNSAQVNWTGSGWEFFNVAPGSYSITVVVQLDTDAPYGLPIPNQAIGEFFDYDNTKRTQVPSNFANFSIIETPEADYIRIELFDGTLVTEGTILTADEELVLYARAYNFTTGFFGNVSVKWSITGGIGVLNNTSGHSIIFNATTVNIGNISAVFGTLSNITGNITVIPGAVVDIKINPPGPEIYSADDTQVYVATGYDSDGNVNTTWVPQWGWLGAGLGDMTLITPDGYQNSIEFNITGNDIVRVFVQGDPSIFNTSSVEVIPGKVVQIIVLPIGAEFNTTDDILNFTVLGYDANGNLNTTWVPEANWQGPSLGTITVKGHTIEVNYTTVGFSTFNITVSSDPSIYNSTKSVTISPGAVFDIKINPPGPETYSADDTQVYVATGYDSDGNINTTWVPQWGWLGSGLGDMTFITPDGYNNSIEFNLTGSDIVRVWVQGNPSIINTSQVTVVAGKVVHIVVLPIGAEFNTTDDILNFTVLGYDANGNLNTTWVPEANWQGPSLGTITVNGYTIEIEYTTVGFSTFNITVSSDPSIYNSTKSVTVSPGAPFQISYISGNGQFGFPTSSLSASFIVYVEDADGNPVPGVKITWTIDNFPPGASGQSVSNPISITDASGQAQTLLTLGDMPGFYFVNATNATLSITGEPVSFSASALSFNIDDIIIGDTLGNPITDLTNISDDTITLFAWAYNKTAGILGQIAVNWSVDGGIGNFTSPTNLQTQVNFHFKWVGEGVISVTFKNATLNIVNTTGVLRVIPGAVVSIILTPSSLARTTDDMDIFRAVAYDAYGNKNWSWDPGWSWDAAGLGTLVQIDPYNYSVSYNMIGSDLVNVSLAGQPGIYDTSDVTVRVGKVIRIAISPWDSVSATSDDTGAFSVMGYDADGFENWSWIPSWSWIGDGLGELTQVDLYNYTVDYNLTGSDEVFVNVLGDLSKFNSTKVSVLPGVVVTITITPDSQSATTDDSGSFSIMGYDADGNQNWIWIPIWQWKGPGLGPLTEIDPYNYTVEYNAIGSDLLNITVTGNPLVYITSDIRITVGKIVRIEISPWPSIDNQTGDTIDFFAIGYDADGFENWTWTPDWGWETTSLGTLTQITPYNYSVTFTVKGADAINVSSMNIPAIYNRTAVSVTEIIVTPTIDYIVIMDAPGGNGNIIDTESLIVAETLKLYAVGFNFTIGYVADVDVTWSVSDDNLGSIITGPGKSTTFTSNLTNGGNVIISATNATITQSTNSTGIITIIPPNVDFILIRDAPSGSGSQITLDHFNAGEQKTYFAAGYNATTGLFVSNIPVIWDITTVIGSIDIIEGLSTNFTASNAVGISTQGTLKATFNVISDQATITVDLPPSIVMDLRVTQVEAGRSLNLSWTASSEPDVVSYIIYRSTQSGAGFSIRGTVNGRENTTFTSTGLDDGVRYYYYIVAVDAGQNRSPPSTEASATSDSNTDGDDLFNLLDPDDDNDGLLDIEEENPGEDGFITDPLNPDTDGDGVIDSEDFDPTDPDVWEKGATEEPQEFPWIILVIVILVIVILLFLMLLSKRKKPEEEMIPEEDVMLPPVTEEEIQEEETLIDDLEEEPQEDVFEEDQEGISDLEYECPECGYPVSDRVSKCPECGTEFEEEEDKDEEELTLDL